MKPSCCSFGDHIIFVILLSCFLFHTDGFNLTQPLCHDEERSALLQFKQSFVIDHTSDSSCSSEDATRLLGSWNFDGGNDDCCSWKGVECDINTGYVVGIDLSNSCLYGSIDSNSTLFQLVHLRMLNLSFNNFNHSKIPVSIGQLSELRVLRLSSSLFSGQIPYAISKLSKLSVLDLSWNVDLNSEESLLELKEPDLSTFLANLTSLEVLKLNYVDISSHVPSFLANFSSLKRLQMEYCRLNGKFPEKILQLQNLRDIYLGENPNLYGYLPEFNSSSFLTNLQLTGTRFYGKLPISIGNLFSLAYLNLNDCNFSGSIPISIGNLTELTYLDLGSNNFVGPIPYSLEHLTNLEMLELQFDDFTDTTTLSWLSKLSKLRVLLLLGLKLHDNTLLCLDNLTKLDLFDLSHNQISGQFPPSIRSLSSLVVLRMNNNGMIGMLPEWLGNFSTSLTILKLRDNMFNGSIPDSFVKKSSLKLMDLSNNQLQGRVPKSLSNCGLLEVINLRKNQLNDVFPSWLGILPNLRVLLLQSNQLYGSIGEPKSSSEFPKLHIIDLSHNYFSNHLPSNYINTWNTMKTVSPHPQFIYLTFKINDVRFMVQHYSYQMIVHYYSYPMAVINKRLETIFSEILDVLSFIDLSCNKFDGQIPYAIGNLRGLKSLNLSFNMLTGKIPSSLGNLKELEALDLSHNKFSGIIPSELLQITFLAIFDVSYNNLSGPIPQGTQLVSMGSGSFAGNPGLCGMPLPKKCGDSNIKKVPFSTSEEEEKEDGLSFLRFGWKPVVNGYGCGVVFGMVIGNSIFTWNEDWFFQTFRIAPNRRYGRRIRRPRINNGR